MFYLWQVTAHQVYRTVGDAAWDRDLFHFAITATDYVENRHWLTFLSNTWLNNRPLYSMVLLKDDWFIFTRWIADPLAIRSRQFVSERMLCELSMRACRHRLFVEFHPSQPTYRLCNSWPVRVGMYLMRLSATFLNNTARLHLDNRANRQVCDRCVIRTVIPAISAVDCRCVNYVSNMPRWLLSTRSRFTWGDNFNVSVPVNY